MGYAEITRGNGCKTCEHAFVTSHGYDFARFRDALDAGNVTQALSAARASTRLRGGKSVGGLGRLPSSSMIRFNGKQCGLCLLDTNAVSQMVKHPDRELRHYFEWASNQTSSFLPAFSVFNLVELRRRPALYQEFLEVFNQYPCTFVKAYQQLVEDEIRTYPTPDRVNPLNYVHSGAAATSGLPALLEAVFDVETVRNEERWHKERASVVQGISALVANFPPASEKYTPREQREFLETTVFQMVAMLDYDFAQKIVGEGKAVDIDAFPSVKAIGFTVWHKFYADRTRRPSLSDAFDIVISSVAPYMDAVVTERNLAAGLRRAMRSDEFMRDLRVFTVADFARGPPS